MVGKKKKIFFIFEGILKARPWGGGGGRWRYGKSVLPKEPSKLAKVVTVMSFMWEIYA